MLKQSTKISSELNFTPVELAYLLKGGRSTSVVSNYAYQLATCNRTKETTILKNALSVIRHEHNLQLHYKHVVH
mgnify:CR=1 FL=1